MPTSQKGSVANNGKRNIAVIRSSEVMRLMIDM